MSEDLKNKLIKKLCFPIKVTTIISIIGIVSMLFLIPILSSTAEMYNYYGIEMPGIVNSMVNLANIFQNNILIGVIIIITALGVIIGINFLWKYIAKKIIISSKLEEAVLEKRVNLFKIIATIVLSILVILFFGIVIISPIVALMDIYTKSFLFEAGNL